MKHSDVCSPTRNPESVEIIELRHSLDLAQKENQRLTQRLKAAQQVEDDLNHALDLNKELHSQLEASRMSSRICDSDSDYDEDVAELKQKLKTAETEVSELRDQLEESFTHIASTGNCKGCKFLRRQVETLKRQVQTRDLTIAELEAKNNQLASELDSAKHDIESWKHETEILKHSVQEEQSDGGCERGIEQFLALLERQSGELQELYPHRNQLAALVVKLQEKLDMIERREQAAEVTEDSISDSSSTMDKLLNDIYEIVPETVQEFVKEISDQPIETQVYEVVRLLVDAQNAPVYSSQSMSVLPTRDPEILGHLEEAMKFIKSLSRSTKDVDTKKAICHQCEKIKNFIKNKEIRPADVVSVFSSEDYEKIIKDVSKLTGRTEVLESPLRELFALFCGVVGANSMLTERNEQIHKQLQKNRQDMDTERRAKEKALENSKRQKEQIEQIRKRLSRSIDGEDKDVFETVNMVLRSLEESRKTCGDLEDKVAQQEQTIKEIKAADRTQEFKKKCHKRGKKIAHLEQVLQQEREDRETMLAQLDVHMKALEKRLEEAEREKKELEELKIKYEKMKQYKEKCKALENDIKELEVKNQDLEISLERLVQENERLQGMIVRLQDKLKKAEIQIRMDRDRKAELKKRIAELEKENTEAIAELRKKNETLQQTHQAMKEKLEAEIESLREKIVGYQATIKEFEESKMERRKIVVQAKLSERALATSLQDALTAIKNAEAQLCSQQKAGDSKIQRMREKYITYIDTCRRSILTILDADPNDYPAMNSVVELLSTLYDPYLMADAINAKKLLSLESKQTIVEGINSLTSTITEQEQELIGQKDKIQELIQKSHVLKMSLDESEEKRKVLHKWVEWANCLYMSVMNDRVVPSTDDALRHELESLVKTAANAPHTTRQLQILRAEKAAFKHLGDRPLTHKSRIKVPRLRSILLLTLFAQRLSDITNHSDMS